MCSQCSGWGAEVVGTHTEYGRYACGICSGTGWTSNTYYDGVLGWQTTQTGCSGCGGAGWLSGAYEANDYKTCKKCQGEGAFAIEGELDLESMDLDEKTYNDMDDRIQRYIEEHAEKKINSIRDIREIMEELNEQ